ncbi:hypothetical protein BDY21DRAFT_339217 [Lineolata rhizophorae]|uniref:Uncharacterized protein n=1 Tax=Lineolata rhizophorae TaxID=578093 RepID=A0A6A6P4D5_9PEZI|nr:hypothetical protein BDY21DRAFT_339217 [Lineolata rhizophorae]
MGGPVAAAESGGWVGLGGSAAVSTHHGIMAMNVERGWLGALLCFVFFCFFCFFPFLPSLSLLFSLF